MKRSAGILLSVSSLPSDYGIGCFSESAYAFVDWLKESGQTYWQILPIGPTSYGDSPYQSFSTFAGNPYFISLKELVKNGWITEQECEETDFGDNNEIVDYEKLYNNRYSLLKKAFLKSDITNDSHFKKFVQNNSQWLEDYSLFMALKNNFGGKAWIEWDEEIRVRNKNCMEEYKDRLCEEIQFQQFMQFEFYQQWNKLKKYANKKGIKIIGDIPIYVAFDSADVWANPKLFQINENNYPIAVAGCPPDGFSVTGQLWGNPLYDWDYHKQTQYSWWISRLKHCFNLYDVVRIDHFRGFDEYYAIPYGEKTAVNGRWEKGPGIELFKAAKKQLGRKEIIAEDLGFMTDSVRQLVKDSGFPNMKVLEFAFDARDSGSSNDYLPHNYNENCVAYTGTHDNQTIVSWFDTISKAEQKMARDYLCDHHTPKKKLHKSFIALLLRSKAKLCIIPLQDYLGYDDTCRMNTPSTIGENWQWRLRKGVLTNRLQKEILRMLSLYGRLNK